MSFAGNASNAPTQDTGTINSQGIHQANGIPGHLLNGTGAGQIAATAHPHVLPRPVSERTLPGSRKLRMDFYETLIKKKRAMLSATMQTSAQIVIYDNNG